MTNRMSVRLGLICGLSAMAIAGPVRAEEGVAMKSLLGNMGLIAREKDPIRYRERAPLVVPPKAELRTPVGVESTAAANPQWPNDPDVAAKRRSAEDSRRPVTQSDTRRMSDNNPRLSPSELQSGRIARSEAPDPRTHRGDNARDVLLLSPDRMRANPKSDADDKLDDQAPGRRVLTEPPSTLRKPASGRGLPNDFTPRADTQNQEASPLGWLTRKFSSGDDDE
ncbi:hypothetical protein [uncultured Enterovirga sp.]|uniref:hypothetical protein n=1 Tax=uncultured Enterovirga sp. TaxID=2026352 RepID=UPI0035C98BA4